jgi:hypothetical protein
VGCLYCGKEIGPFRLLRDSEFCSVAHRDRYHDRLGRALDRLGAAEPPPAGVAGFRIAFPLQDGTHSHVSTFSPFGAGRPSPRAAESLRVSPAAPLSGPHASLPQPVLVAAVPQSGHLNSLPVPLRFPRLVKPSAAALLSVLPLCDEPMRTGEPEPIEHFVFPVAAGMIELAAQPPSIAAIPVSSVFIAPVADAAPVSQPEPATVDVFPLLDSRPAVRAFVPAFLRFGLHPVDEIAARPKPAPLRSTQLAAACASPAPVPVESMPAFPAFVPAALATTVGAGFPEFSASSPIAAPRRVAPLPAPFVPGLRAMAVESLPAIPPAVPAPLATPLAVRCPALTHFQPAQEPADALAAPAPAPGPEAVEAFPAVPAITSLPVAPPILLIRRALQASPPLESAAGLSHADFHTLSAPPSEPMLPAKPVVVPMARMSPQPAGAQPERPRPAIPHPGLFALEYYCQRSTASTPYTELDWMRTPVVVRKQPFQVPAALKPFATYGNKSRKLLPFEEIFAGQTKDGEPISFRFAAAAKIAATIMVGLALWSGSQIAHLSQFRAQVESSERNVTAVAEVHSSASGNGPIAAFRRAIAARAATEITDTFVSGMEAWGATPKSWAAGWQHSPDGYVRTGEMALFRPSLQYTDYHMEFYGQIEQKSMGWVVRARDRKNYYAMKFTVIEPGLRPIIAMQHYQVTNGKRGRIVQTPLNVMVHNNQPYHVAVDIRGNHFATAIEGDPVDSWTDDALAQGGIGFFSDPGERARLYWMKVSRNQDWLGRFCAYLSGDSRTGARQTAGLRLPSVPQFWALSLAPCGPAQ